MWVSKLGERSACYHILHEMKVLVNNFQGFKLLYASRSANQAAHCTAKEALVLNSITNFDVIPGFLVAVVQSEKFQPVE